MANVIITGANQGIGYYFVERRLQMGDRVAVLDLETDRLAELKQHYGKNLLYFTVDVRSFEDVRSAVEAASSDFGPIDAAIHNACKCTFSIEANTGLEVYREVIDVNYFGALHLVKAVTPYMQPNGGRILFTSSGVGVTGFDGLTPYASTKGALESLAKCLNLEYAARNISFHIFHPPLTRTKSASPLPVPKEFMASPEEVGRGLAKNLMAKRFIICHNFFQKLQTMGCYLFPVKMGRLMSKMTAAYTQQSAAQN